MKEAEKAAAAKVKEDAKIAKEIAKTAKKVTQMMMVGGGWLVTGIQLLLSPGELGENSVA